MRKFAALGLIAAIGAGASLWSAGAEARTYVGVGIGLPGVAVGVGPAYGVRYARPYPYRVGPYWAPYGIPYGYRGWYGPHYHYRYHGYGRW